MAYIYESDVGRLGGNLQKTVGYLLSLHKAEYEWNLLGIKVVGHVDALPIPEGTYEYGDAYTVGTAAPYDMWIYTRADEFHSEAYWFNIGKFPAPGPQGPKGDGVETFTNILLTHDIYSGDVYGSDNGQTYNGKSTIQYKDSTTGKTKSQDIYTTVFLPIVGSDYINIDGDAANSRFVVRLDDTALALDYYKIDKSKATSTIPYWDGTKAGTLKVDSDNVENSVAQRNANGDCSFNKVYTSALKTLSGSVTVSVESIFLAVENPNSVIQKTSTDTGVFTENQLLNITFYKTRQIQYDNKIYYYMDPKTAPNGTINFIHIDTVQDGNGGYKATGKCFSITVSTRAWQVVDLDFGGSTRTTHNLTLTNSSTGMSIYFSLTNNRTETYEGAPAGLLAALENSQIACTVDANGTYSAGMITTEGTNFKATYGNGEEALIEQMQVSITDSMV